MEFQQRDINKRRLHRQHIGCAPDEFANFIDNQTKCQKRNKCQYSNYAECEYFFPGRQMFGNIMHTHVSPCINVINANIKETMTLCSFSILHYSKIFRLRNHFFRPLTDPLNHYKSFCVHYSAVFPYPDGTYFTGDSPGSKSGINYLRPRYITAISE